MNLSFSPSKFWPGASSLIDTPVHTVRSGPGRHPESRKLANQDESLWKEIVDNVEIHSQKYLCTCPCTSDYVMHPYFSSSAEKEHVLHAGDPSYTSAPTLPIRISVPSLLYVQQIFLLSWEELSLWDLVLTPHQSYLL